MFIPEADAENSHAPYLDTVKSNLETKDSAISLYFV
ncbi:hypothetical protein SAMN06265348_101532 [Pedobacter westerhofensis]|uniref:Uncharacterized protein n=1 Tax=Pedobacter westerhofensis TaxID=425512 RepID=A0A521AXR6_9SPHI|nr:hypothetical protein SAMN06265348_101532 [Pedobacter westerhofensis]